VMTRGAFASMKHDHRFETSDGATVMRDRFQYRSPLGPLGALVDWTFLEAYMRKFLGERARMLRETAESDGWQQFLR
jgi:ligand-binding SRPBCC domain-containing protein